MKNLYKRAIVFLCMLALPSLCHAQLNYTPGHVYKLVSNLYSRVLEIGGGGNLYHPDVPAYAWPYWGGANQQWMFQDVGGGFFALINRNSGLALGTMGTYSQTASCYGARVGQNYYGGFDAQQWSFELVSGTVDTYRIKNRRSGYYLNYVAVTNPYYPCYNAGDREYANIVQDGNSNQNWRLEDVTPNPNYTVVNSVFQIINNNSGKALSASPDGDINVGQMTAWGLGCEEWTFSPADANGYVQIINRNTQQVLEIGGNGDITQPGRLANIWNNVNGLNQKWALLEVGGTRRFLTVAEATDGRTFQIYNANSGRLLEIGGGATNDGASANQWDDYGHPWQQWHVQFASFNRTMAQTSTDPIKMNGTATDTQTMAYPNPVTNTLTLPEGIEQAVLLNNQGLPVQQTKGTTLNVSNLPAGLYNLRMVQAGKVISQHIEVQH